MLQRWPAIARRVALLAPLAAGLLFSTACGVPAGSAPGQAQSEEGQDTRDENYAELRRRMVARQIEARGVRDPRVLEAMRRVPRHRFVPSHLVSQAYSNFPLRIGHEQTISQPYIVALMTELLAVESGDKVFEVGTGSGYQAAVLAELGAEVYSIEIVEPLAREAAERLKVLQYSTVTVRAGDGYLGWPEHAPFDAIIVTCAPDHVPRPLIDQLKPGGRMCIPVGPAGGNQELYLLTKQSDGTLKTDRVLSVRFVPLTGEHGAAR